MACLAALALQALPTLAHAAPSTPTGLSFSHHDWDLACDNTRTCRAVGFQPLGGGHWLVSKLCWRGAYNAGSCAWGVNERAPRQLELVTDSASDIGEGEIWASQKSRGLGDCWHHEAWTWDGRHFVQTSASSSGQCKLVTPGGAWELPTLVTKVVKP